MHLADEARSFKIVVEGGDMKITTLSLALTEPPDQTVKTEVQCTSPPPAPKH
jgi:hypothetical protein